MARFGRAQPAPPSRGRIPFVPPGTITITGWVNNTNTDLSGFTTINVAVYDLTTRALVYLATGLTVVSGAVSFSHSSIVPGTWYRVLADQDGNTTDHGCARLQAT